MKTNKNNEAHKHHYIPQFIIKNFSENRDGWVWYYEKRTNAISLKHCSEIFLSKDLYRDEINNPDKPTKIENDLSVFEREVSEIITKFTTNGSNIAISYDDGEKIKFFFALMAFRSKTTSDLFNKRLSEESREVYSFWQEDGNMTSFWKRNLGQLVNCRSIVEVLDSKTIDEPIKKFMIRDTFGLAGLYLNIVERRGSEDFFLSDCYPLSFDGETPDGKKALLYHIIPISPSRALIIAANGVEYVPLGNRGLDDKILKKCSIEHGFLSLHVKKIYQKDIEFINKEIAKHYTQAAFFDKQRFVIREDEDD